MSFKRIRKYISDQFTPTSFEQRKLFLVIRVLVISTLMIYLSETLLMVFLEYILKLSDPLALLLDGLILVIVLFPINYFLIVRPMSKQIDEHDATNQALLKVNEVLERFFEISDILIAYMDTQFNFIRVNAAYAATDQRPAEDYIGKNHFDLFPNAENRTIFEQVVNTGQPFVAVEKPFEYADHPERGISYWDWSLLPVKNSGGQVIALILVLNNVTARKKAQLALTESEHRFRGVFNQTFQHSAILDSEGKILLVNQTALDFTGLSQAEIQGQCLWCVPWWDTSLGGPAVIEQIKEQVDHASGGRVVRFEQRIRSQTGAKAVMDITIKPVHDDRGAAILLIYEARDITERYRAEEALKYSEAENKRLYISEREARQFAESLRSAVLALSGSLNSDTVLGMLLDRLKEVVPYTSAHILLLDDDEHLAVRLARGEENWSDHDRLAGKKYDIASFPFFSGLLDHREIILVPDTILYPGKWFFASDEFVRSWLAIPLLAGEQIVGVCMVEHFCPGFFTDDRVHWATVLTSQAAVAIQNAWLYEQVRDGREQMQALSRRLVEVQEYERRYISRELHDEAGQALASLMIGLRHLEHDSADPEAVISHSRELKQIADTVIENLHRLAVDLRPAALDHLGLAAALRQHAELISYKHKLAIQFETIGSIDRLSNETETAIYRIVQESLTNVVRHAQASRVDVLLERRSEQFIVVIEDNGVGFDTQKSKGTQVGILGMTERAEMLGGKLTVESTPGKGTTVILEVPCPFESC